MRYTVGMTFFVFAMTDSFLGYSAVFLCLGFGLFVLARAMGGVPGTGYWSASFVLCAVGFLFWSKVLPLLAWQYLLAGEMAHIAGFLCLVAGIQVFTGGRLRLWHLIPVAVWLALWLGSIAVMVKDPALGGMVSKVCRSILFTTGGILILTRVPAQSLIGRRLAGGGLLAWAAYILVLAFVDFPDYAALSHLLMGFLVGFQILSVLGLVVLVIDQLRLRAEESETRVVRLEGLLPICSYCKRIRDEEDQWQPVEQYIRDRSDTDFSHGICPNCVSIHFPEVGTGDGHKKEG